ncbi:hypothetical protein [Leptospira noguchii]|uniref:Uncharacterized protein n=1 Tax=Leptospira noguchii TaxID=28182 RepID=A0A9Q8RK85_9LEPT|nr:hypothetical protein [Leptospira noguchii]UOG29020.1 hypothetical protein MAL06_09840 [Leptospira noguchii]UOG32876.1 hypothetical protein MAL02_09070 [Leptospira noguchii]UOG39304.1 hypothetical protein MAL08_08615 [Leptospira noguchii]UOG43039.1 hypothetical protein MAL05_08460 [Leptospira noguchii]UOG43678.1 hypothetical protein MAL01_09240 [Leptospira noguchii]
MDQSVRVFKYSEILTLLKNPILLDNVKGIDAMELKPGSFKLRVTQCIVS